MFAIYGTSGQMFQGPVEELRRTAAVSRSQRVRRVQSDRDEAERQDAGSDSGRWRPAQEGRAPPYQDAPASAQASQALQAYAQIQRPPDRHPLSAVADVMSRDPLVLAQDLTLHEAWAQLAAQGLGQAPVVNAQNRLVGLLGRAELQDLERLPAPDASALVWRAFMLQPVSAAMVSPVPSVAPDTDLRRLALALLETGLPGLPVVERDGVVMGFVSRTDILRAVVHDPPLDLWAG